jgi:hypothetical protein
MVDYVNISARLSQYLVCKCSYAHITFGTEPTNSCHGQILNQLKPGLSGSGGKGRGNLAAAADLDAECQSPGSDGFPNTKTLISFATRQGYKYISRPLGR